MDALYARGTAARARESAAALSHGADPGNLPCGYYLVREAQHWRVVRWMPQAYRWELGRRDGLVGPVLGRNRDEGRMTSPRFLNSRPRRAFTAERRADIARAQEKLAALHELRAASARPKRGRPGERRSS